VNNSPAPYNTATRRPQYRPPGETGQTSHGRWPPKWHAVQVIAIFCRRRHQPRRPPLAKIETTERGDRTGHVIPRPHQDRQWHAHVPLVPGAVRGWRPARPIVLDGANLTETNLTKAILIGARLAGADLSGADLTSIVFHVTTLRNVKGLDRCNYLGPSSFDFPTLQISGPLPIAFLRGIGLPDRLIDYLPSLLNEAIQHYALLLLHQLLQQR
jgi:Pentapeptide repeats (8 copies)